MTLNIKPTTCYSCGKEYSFTDVKIFTGANIANCKNCNRNTVVEVD